MAAGLMAARAADQGHQMMAVGDIARNPENPGRLDDLDGLAESIAEVGVLQPLLVCSRSAYSGPRPEVEISGDWVLLAGERRLAAASRAGVAEVPVVVRDDLAAPGLSHAVVSAENGLREGLSPMQEAEQYRAMVDSGLSQRRIASLVGRSSGHITKRLKLLAIPEAARTTLGQGIDISGALALAEVPSDLQDAVLERAKSLQELDASYASGRPIQNDDVADALAWVTAEMEGGELMTQAVDEGAREVEEVPYRQTVYSDQERAEALQAGTLIVARRAGSTRLTYGDTRLGQKSTATSQPNPEKERRARMRRLRAGTQAWIAEHLRQFQTQDDQTVEFARWIVDHLSKDLGVEIWKAVRDLGVGAACDPEAYTPEQRRWNEPYYDWANNLSDADVVTVAALAPILQDLRDCEYGSSDKPSVQRTEARLGASTEAPATTQTASTEAPAEGDHQ